jgi:protein-tyrosine kinase
MNMDFTSHYRRVVPHGEFDASIRNQSLLATATVTTTDQAVSPRTHQPIARAQRPPELSPLTLEARGLIHAGTDAYARAQADAFREIRTRLLAMGGKRNFIVLVVPIEHGDGASFVARNLAAAFALDPSKRALLIDCNLHAPIQHRVLDVEAARGDLIDYLKHPVRDFHGIVYPTGIANLDLLPTRSSPSVGREYYSSPQLRNLLDALRDEDDHRYLFLDGPPVNGSPDARILAELANFVILVCGYARATVKTLSQAAAVFDPATFAGVVFNEGR